MDVNVYKYDRYILGSIIGGITGMIGNAQQSNNINKQINAQKQQNKENNKYNYMLAQKQNEWNLQQWMRENEYNLPANQMKRYKDAGLNPDLMYQQSNLSAQSPQMTSGAPSSPVDMSALGQKPTIDRAISQALNASSTFATIGNTKANTTKTESDTRWQDLLNQNVYKQGLLDLDFGKLNLFKTSIDCQEGLLNLEQINQNLSMLPLRIEKMRSEIRSNDMSAYRDFVTANLTQKDIDHYAEKLQIEKDKAKAQLTDALTNMANGRAYRMLVGEQWYALSLANNGTLALMPTPEQFKELRDAKHRADMADQTAREAHSNKSAWEDIAFLDDPTKILLSLDLLTGIAGRVFGGNVSYTSSHSNANVNSSSISHSTSHSTNHNFNYRP